MAKLSVLAVRDSALGAYSRPIFVPSVSIGVRSFSDEVNRQAPDNPMYEHSADFELHWLAEFVEESGTFIPLEGGVSVVVRAKDVRKA